MIALIYQDAFAPGEKIRLISGQFQGCCGTIVTDRRTYDTPQGPQWGYAVDLNGSSDLYVVSEAEMEHTEP